MQQRRAADAVLVHIICQLRQREDVRRRCKSRYFHIPMDGGKDVRKKLAWYRSMRTVQRSILKPILIL